MTELAFLGSLLGMPSIFDPMFPATYSSFFGSYPSWMQEGVEEVDLRGGGGDKEHGKTGDDDVPVSPVLSNVSSRVWNRCFATRYNPWLLLTTNIGTID